MNNHERELTEQQAAGVVDLLLGVLHGDLPLPGNRLFADVDAERRDGLMTDEQVDQNQLAQFAQFAQTVSDIVSAVQVVVVASESLVRELHDAGEHAVELHTAASRAREAVKRLQKSA